MWLTFTHRSPSIQDDPVSEHLLDPPLVDPVIYDLDGDCPPPQVSDSAANAPDVGSAPCPVKCALVNGGADHGNGGSGA